MQRPSWSMIMIVILDIQQPHFSSCSSLLSSPFCSYLCSGARPLCQCHSYTAIVDHLHLLFGYCFVFRFVFVPLPHHHMTSSSTDVFLLAFFSSFFRLRVMGLLYLDPFRISFLGSCIWILLGSHPYLIGLALFVDIWPLFDLWGSILA
jgi:hypothetical protein